MLLSKINDRLCLQAQIYYLSVYPAKTGNKSPDFGRQLAMYRSFKLATSVVTHTTSYILAFSCQISVVLLPKLLLVSELGKHRTDMVLVQPCHFSTLCKMPGHNTVECRFAASLSKNITGFYHVFGFLFCTLHQR